MRHSVRSRRALARRIAIARRVAVPSRMAIAAALRWATVVQACVALVVAASPAVAQIHADVVAAGFTQPVAFVQDPSDPSVQVVVQQNGRVAVLKNGVRLATDYLDLSAVVSNVGEQGLLGLAFAPDYATSGRVFVNFINVSGHTVIARFLRSASNPLRADPASRFDLRWPDGQRFITQPFGNHNGGNLAFGPDGYLYAGLGDGGSGGDPLNLAQNPLSLLGKMLRLDVSVTASDPDGYDVPATNPFVGRAGVLAEIWSLGWRNPWRWSFDNPRRGGTGALVVADVGQNLWEEIDYEPAGRGGRNYGWSLREGAHDYQPSVPPFSLPPTEPIYEYSHAVGVTVAQGGVITGGFVYRGAELGAAYRGRYFFAEFTNSRIWSVKLTVNAATGEATASDIQEHTDELGVATTNVASFGEDADGELYTVSYAGTVYRVRGAFTPATVGVRRHPPGGPIVGYAVPRGGGSGTVAAALVTNAKTSVAVVAAVAALTALRPLPMPSRSIDPTDPDPAEAAEGCVGHLRVVPRVPCALKDAIGDAIARLLPGDPDLARALAEAVFQIDEDRRGGRK